MRPVQALTGLVFPVAITAFGCAWLSRPDNTLVAGNEGAPGVKRFLVCAPNTVIALPAELQGVEGAVREQVDAYLQFHGRETQWIDLYESKQLWGQAMSAAKEKGTAENAPVFFAAQADELYDFDAIVMPAIFVHKVRATDGGAVWDGVSRQMELKNRPLQPVGHIQDTFAQGVQFGGVTGDVLVTSVHVLVYSRTGERIFQGRGGFAFVHDADMSSVRGGSWHPKVRDLAADVDAMREGVAIAFDPYLPEAD